MEQLVSKSPDSSVDSYTYKKKSCSILQSILILNSHKLEHSLVIIYEKSRFFRLTTPYPERYAVTQHIGFAHFAAPPASSFNNFLNQVHLGLSEFFRLTKPYQER